jgi:hypothetical protein
VVFVLAAFAIFAVGLVLLGRATTDADSIGDVADLRKFIDPPCVIREAVFYAPAV